MRSHARQAALAALCLLPVAALAAPKNKPAPQAQPEPTADLSQPLTLDRAIQIALQNHSSVGIARAQLSSARAGITRAQAAYYPNIAPSYDYTSQLTTQRFNGVTQTGTVTQSITQIGANLLLFDMGKREENVLVSKYGARSAQYGVAETRQTVIVNTASSYYDLLRTKDLVKVAQATVDRAKTTLDYTQAAAEAGALAQKDILQAQADYQNALVQFGNSQNNVRVAQTTLKNAMGIVTPQPILTPDTPLPAPSPEPDKLTVADYVKQALDNRPDLRATQANIDANRHNVKIANINAGFQVNASVNEGYRIDPVPGENRTFGTSFSYPLFDGGAARAAVRQAKATLEQSRLQLELARQQAQLDVEQSYLLREQARQNVVATQAAVRAARENYTAAQEAAKAGAVSGTVLDIITAEASLVTAETNAVQAIYDYYTNDARLQRAIGRNDTYAGGTKS